MLIYDVLVNCFKAKRKITLILSFNLSKHNCHDKHDCLELFLNTYINLGAVCATAYVNHMLILLAFQVRHTLN